MGNTLKASKTKEKIFEWRGWVGKSPYGQNQHKWSATKCSTKFVKAEGLDLRGRV